MATIKDVAKRAGVAISTVSNVINNKGNVAPATVQKVNDAIRELDYKTNYIAKVMKNRQPKRIGLIVDDLCGLFYPYVIRPIRQMAEERGYELVLYDTNSNSEKEWGIFESLICSQIDGIIFSTSACEGVKLLIIIKDLLWGIKKIIDNRLSRKLALVRIFHLEKQ